MSICKWVRENILCGGRRDVMEATVWGQLLAPSAGGGSNTDPWPGALELATLKRDKAKAHWESVVDAAEAALVLPAHPFRIRQDLVAGTWLVERWEAERVGPYRGWMGRGLDTATMLRLETEAYESRLSQGRPQAWVAWTTLQTFTDYRTARKWLKGYVDPTTVEVAFDERGEAVGR